MAYPTIKLKKSSVAGKRPDSADLAYGELAVNYNDGKLYYKSSSNAVKTFLDSGNIVDLIDSAYVQARQSATALNAFDSADFNSMFAAKSTTNLSEGTNKYYTKARADSDDKYPTAYAWTAGTTAGPTGSLTGTNLTAISFPAIPAAGAAASGIITTDTQTIAGTKTFSSTITGSVSGNAGTATTLATGRNFSLTGEVTAPAISFNGSGVVTLSTTIATDAVDSSNILALSVSSAKLQGNIPDSKLATIATAGKVSNSATTATDANTANAIVARNASGNFSAGTITAALTGAASSNVLKAGDTMTGQLISTLANSATTGGGQIYLNGASGNRIDFNTNGVAGPSLTTRSAGTKLLLYPTLSGVAVDYAMGISSATMWSSVPVNDSSYSFKWYGGDIQVASLTGNGRLTAVAFSGPLTGNVTGNASTATTLATGRNFSLTGEVTAPAISFNGSGVVALSTTIATDAVDSSNILALSVSTAKIQNSAVTTAKIAVGAVDSNALGLLSVSTGDIKNNAVTYAKMQTVATANRLLGSTSAGGAVSEVQIATGMIATGAVDSNALGALSVSSAKLQGSIPDSKLATISTALKVSNSATTATDANTASAIVARDGSGNFSAGTITATLSGSASTLTTGRNFSLTGPITASAVSFNGSGAVALSTAITAGAVDSAALGALSVSSAKLQANIPDSKLATIATAGKVSNSATTATNLNTASAIVARDGSGNFTAGTITATLSGSATTLTTPRTIGDVSFNGSANIVPERTLFKDTRAVNHNPYTYPGTTLHLKQNTTDGLADGGTYHGVLDLQHWSDSSGGKDHQLGLTDNGNMYIRNSINATTWTSWVKIIDSGDTTALNTANTLVRRDANGNFSAGTITTAAVDTATAATHYYVETASDGAIRPKTLANVQTEVVTTAVLGSGTANGTTYLAGDRTWKTVSAGATGGGSDTIFFENSQVVTTNYTITDGKNAMTAGPITINNGVTITIGDGEVWTIV